MQEPNGNQNQDLEHIVIKIGEQKKVLRVEGLNNIHPIYEAVIALLRKNLQDKDICERFLKDENSLREILVADAILDRLNSYQKNSLISLLKSGSSLKEIVDRAAIDIAEDKRAKDGKVLYSAQNYANESNYFMNALKYAPANSIYINSSEIPKIQEKARQIKKNRIMGFIAAGIASITLLFGGYLAWRYFSLKSPEEQNIPYNKK